MHQKHPPTKIAVSKLIAIILSNCFSGLIIQPLAGLQEPFAWEKK